MTSTNRLVAELLDHDQHSRLSLYMPTYRAGREQRQNQIRFQNLLNDAEKLLEHEPDAAEANILLGKLQRVVEDDEHELWQHPTEGLAVFATAQGFRYHRLPSEVEEQVHVGERFYLRPLVSLLQSEARYFVIAVSTKQVRLFEGSRESLNEVNPESLPRDMQDALNIDEYITSLQYYSFKRRGDGEAVYHGHGAGEDDHKKNLLQYFHRLDDALQSYLADRSEPMLFAGVDYLFPIFRDAVGYPHLLDEAVEGNMDDATVEALHAEAWSIIEPLASTRIDEALQKFGDAHGQDRACQKVEDVLVAATRGAVDTLLIRKGSHCWGQMGTDGTVVVHDEPQETSLDLLDEAIFETLRNGGEVFEVDDTHFPVADVPCAAVLRYPAKAATAT